VPKKAPESSPEFLLPFFYRRPFTNGLLRALQMFPFDSARFRNSTHALFGFPLLRSLKSELLVVVGRHFLASSELNPCSLRKEISRSSHFSILNRPNSWGMTVVSAASREATCS